ncbi:hypothetical protein R3P38DRAFT_190699 [Favolaschia claudopus]|uniref:Secreted protein n=1 Tax=Favolaschia claudopus TaxID=2862362 RepID=A0AAW0D388_9AGAR
MASCSARTFTLSYRLPSLSSLLMFMFRRITAMGIRYRSSIQFPSTHPTACLFRLFSHPFRGFVEFHPPHASLIYRCQG